MASRSASSRRWSNAFTRAGIAVILDVVFNHTAEGNERGPTQSFRGIDNALYYLVDPATGAYRDYTGCGNTLNCNHPRVRELIIDVLRYWVAEMHVDGFRFDLASILGRGEDGSVLVNPPIIEQIAEDPVLRQTALIAEAWDAAGLYQVGHFIPRGPLGGMERQVPRRRAPLRQGRPGHGLGAGDPPGRQP